MTLRATRVAELYRAQEQRNHVQTDRLFAGLMAFQWVFGIACALIVSPRTWSGADSAPHLHLYAAVVLGGALAALPIALALRRPGQPSTRHAIALCQTLFSALLIHLTGGRIETHFHVFGSLAFLAFYADFRVLVSATLVVAVDHALRGVFWPQSVFGIAAAAPWRWLEHAGWVIFEDVFLLWWCRRSTAKMREVAERQAELEETNAAIERQVEQRTAELAEARDQALEAARLKAEFLANMSHEIRTPLNGVLGFVQLLRESRLDGEQAEYVATIQDSGETLLALLNDILDFSKIEAGKLELERVEFEPVRVLDGVARLLGVPAEAKGIEFVCDSSALEGRRFVGDPTRLRQVVLNLGGNAVKFTERGEVAIVAEVHEHGDTVDLLLHVRDTGIGIPADRQADLFQAFRQVDGSTTRRFGGTGLGLAISRRLVELMGGTIRVQSEVGRGSTFSVSIAFEQRQGEPAQAPDLAGCTYLVVDDNATNRRLVRDILHRRGARTLLADGPDAALSLLRDAARRGAAVHGALIDFQMPDMDGLALARAIRALPAFESLPLLLLTSVHRLDPDEVRSAGYSSHMVKPLRAASLLEAVLACRHDRGRDPAPVEVGAAPPAAAPPVEPAAAPAAAAEPRRRLNILLVEDNPVNQRLAVTLLRRRGHRVDVAGDGAQGVAAVRELSYDLVLMDAQMPVMDGFTATHEIRRSEAGSDRRLPIIALTAHALAGYREACLAAGMDDYLTKPIRPEELDRVLAPYEAHPVEAGSHSQLG